MIVIVGSRRFSTQIHELREYLINAGHMVVSAPYPDIVYDDSLTSQWANRGLILDHLYKLECASSCLVFNPDGYVGTNSILEIGYFINTRKPIYACHKTGEACIDIFMRMIIGSTSNDSILKAIQRFLC